MADVIMIGFADALTGENLVREATPEEVQEILAAQAATLVVSEPSTLPSNSSTPQAGA